MNIKFFLTFLLLTTICFSSLNCGFSDKTTKGNEAIIKIEEFKSKNGKLPNSLSEVEIVETENGPIYYERKNDSKYILWFGKELGESVTYDSDTKQWK